VIAQVPVVLLFLQRGPDEHNAAMGHPATNISLSLMVAYMVNGAFFHFQTISAYVLMDYISPVTHRSVNT
jgi:solute carrier family 35 protein E2